MHRVSASRTLLLPPGPQRPRPCIWSDAYLQPDIIIAARLQPGNEEILDYYLLPRLDVLTERLSLRPDNGLALDVYRFTNLNFFLEMAERVRIEGAA